MHLDLGRWICKVLEWTPEEAIAYSRINLYLLQRLKRSMGDSEPPDIFQHQSTAGAFLGFESGGCSDCCCQLTHAQHGLLLIDVTSPTPSLCCFCSTNVVSCYLFSVLAAIV